MELNPSRETIKRYVRYIVGWIDRMSDKYGSIVHDQNGKWWDWGQALCIEAYGWPDEVDWPDDPDRYAVECAQVWEAGEWPDWAVKPED